MDTFGGKPTEAECKFFVGFCITLIVAFIGFVAYLIVCV